MKKIFLVGLISLFLSGCDKTVSDEVVSDKMFIGDWKCNYIDYKSIWDGNNFGEYKIDEKFEVLVTFKYENNSLYSKITNKDEWTKRSLVEEYNNKTIQDEDGFLKMKVTKSLKKYPMINLLQLMNVNSLVKMKNMIRLIENLKMK